MRKLKVWSAFQCSLARMGQRHMYSSKQDFRNLCRNFENSANFDTKKVPKMGSNQNMSKFSPWTGISWCSWRTIVTVITFLQKTLIFITLYLICTQKAQYWCKSQCRKFCMNARGKHSRGRFLRYIARFLRFSGVICFQTHKVMADLRFFVPWSKIKEMF